MASDKQPITLDPSEWDAVTVDGIFVCALKHGAKAADLKSDVPNWVFAGEDSVPLFYVSTKKPASCKMHLVGAAVGIIVAGAAGYLIAKKMKR